VQQTTKIKHTKIKTQKRQITNYTKNYKHKLTVTLRNHITLQLIDKATMSICNKINNNIPLRG